tara:strand:- start:36 stop:443 length:408 start_codon:yes stop_codon:yes gene_type:complete
MNPSKRVNKLRRFNHSRRVNKLRRFNHSRRVNHSRRINRSRRMNKKSKKLRRHLGGSDTSESYTNRFVTLHNDARLGILSGKNVFVDNDDDGKNLIVRDMNEEKQQQYIIPRTRVKEIYENSVIDIKDLFESLKS